MKRMANFWTQLKQSPSAIAFLVFIGAKIMFYVQEPNMTWRLEFYFGAVLFFCAWGFQKSGRDVQTWELSDEQREEFAHRWRREVEYATRKLAEFTKIVSPSGKSFREWTDRERNYFHEHFRECDLVYLADLAQEFKRDKRRVWLKRWWECAADMDDDKVLIPSTKELWETGERNGAK